jgi:hypothetical protein
MEETGISTTAQRGYKDLCWSRKKSNYKIESREKEIKCPVEPPFTKRSRHRHHHRSLVSRATMERAQGADPFVQVTTSSWSQDMTQKD